MAAHHQGSGHQGGVTRCPVWVQRTKPLARYRAAASGSEMCIASTAVGWGTPLRRLEDRNDSTQAHPRDVLTSQRFGRRSCIMTATSTGRIIVPYLALSAACGAALVFGFPHLRREPPVEIRAATAAATALVVPPDSSDRGDESMPVFDVARVEGAGDAVIAGRAAPGAIVELLRNGELQDRAVADQSGQFVMVPPRLPAGSYELTLRSRQPNGKQAASKQSVAVALQPSLKDQPVAEEPHRTAATRPSDESSPSVVIAPKITVVSRGDSLWRISRVTYGTGMRYAVIYEANRHQIRDQNLIYPRQILVLPKKAR
jgi:LysM repeat protein